MPTMKFCPLTIPVIALIASASPAVADSQFAKEMEDLIAGLPYIGASAPVTGTNIEGRSVFTNMQNAIENDQFFLRWMGAIQYEKASTPVAKPEGIYWCSSIEPGTKIFGQESTAMSVPPAYSSLCLYAPTKDQADQISKSGANMAKLTTGAFSSTNSFSAIFVPELNVMAGALHTHADNFVRNFWDDGTTTMPQNGYEVLDEASGPGNSWSGYGGYYWISANETAEALGVNATELTPNVFETMYEEIYVSNGNSDSSDTNSRTFGTNGLVSHSLFFLLLATIGGEFLW